jgi:cytochrome c-type biogenesis protein CcmH/NrfG
MGWIILLILAFAVFVALWRFARLNTGALQFLLAALLFAAAGYTWQGNPSLSGAPRGTAEKPIPSNPFADVRRDLFGGFDASDRWLTISESFQRRGDTQAAAGVLRSAIRAHPNNATLWTGYGNALMMHGGGTISPAADLAFRRAEALAPKHPAPRLLHGMALLTGGRFADAERVWKEALALAPASAPYRAGIERHLETIARARAAGQIR